MSPNAQDRHEDLLSLVAVIALVIWAVLMIAMIRGEFACRREGGAYVRTDTWFTCLHPARRP